MTSPSFDIVRAHVQDVNELEHLVELCYRGDLSKSGWTSAADIFKGPRVSLSGLMEDMVNPAVAIFKGESVKEDTDLEKSHNSSNMGKIVACVRTERHGDNLHFEMLCVHPNIQNLGVGRKLLGKVEEYARESGCRAVQMTVLLQRTELLAWYERRGYQRTGREVLLPHWDGQEKLPIKCLLLEKLI